MRREPFSFQASDQDPDDSVALNKWTDDSANIVAQVSLSATPTVDASPGNAFSGCASTNRTPSEDTLSAAPPAGGSTYAPTTFASIPTLADYLVNGYWTQYSGTTAHP